MCVCVCASLEVLRVLRQRHLDDVQRILVMLLSREQQGQQVQGVDVVSLELQRLSNVTQRLGDLRRKTHTNYRFVTKSWDKTRRVPSQTSNSETSRGSRCGVTCLETASCRAK